MTLDRASATLESSCSVSTFKKFERFPSTMLSDFLTARARTMHALRAKLHRTSSR